jgi:hypothetical protein
LSIPSIASNGTCSIIDCPSAHEKAATDDGSAASQLAIA